MRLLAWRGPGVAVAMSLAGCNAIWGIGSNYHRVAPVAGGASGTSNAGATGGGRGGSDVAGHAGASSPDQAGEGSGAGNRDASAGGVSGSTSVEKGGGARADAGANGGEDAAGAAGAAGNGAQDTCGDGVVGHGEECDDRNQSSGDGCSAACTVESGWVCTKSSPSVCTRPSCAGMNGTECGSGDDCCASPVVTGGTFTQGKGASGAFQSTVSDFRLDRYEVTVGRFRRFVDAYDAWLAAGNPLSGAGANPHVGGSGWDVGWASRLQSSAKNVKERLSCSAMQTWSDSGQDTLPLNCVDWPLAFAFCIWDGGRLPTEAEWEYAATGGKEQFWYPWGDSPVPTNEPDGTLAYAAYDCLGDGSAPQVCSFADILPVGSKPAGRGVYGQDDLDDSMEEWVFDWYADYPTSAKTNYAKVDSGVDRVVRGGDWLLDATTLLVTTRSQWVDGTEMQNLGFRCARSP